MRSVVLLSLMIVFIGMPRYSQQTFWRCTCPKPTSPPTLPANPKSAVYQKLQKIPSPKETAQSILDNFVSYKPKSRGKRSIKEEDIIIVLDGSGSIGSCQFKEAKKAMETMIKLCPEQGKDFLCRYSAVSYSSSATEVFRSLFAANAAPKIASISYNGGGTNTHAALEKARKIIEEEARIRPFAHRRVLLVTDGQSSNRRATIASAEKLKKLSNVKVFVIAIGQYVYGIDEMAKVATLPPDKTVYRVAKPSGLPYIFELALHMMGTRGKPLPKKPLKSPCYGG